MQKQTQRYYLFKIFFYSILLAALLVTPSMLLHEYSPGSSLEGTAEGFALLGTLYLVNTPLIFVILLLYWGILAFRPDKGSEPTEQIPSDNSQSGGFSGILTRFLLIFLLLFNTLFVPETHPPAMSLKLICMASQVIMLFLCRILIPQTLTNLKKNDGTKIQETTFFLICVASVIYSATALARFSYHHIALYLS
ncbi:MAG: hypothetical protein EOM80_16500 [Erysipelotrichia bacterium]|nr:hypothetical protein [Erysipelotrichia bacterium]